MRIIRMTNQEAIKEGYSVTSYLEGGVQVEFTKNISTSVINIPDYIDDKKVKAIKQLASRGIKLETNLLVLPKYLELVGYGAFLGSRITNLDTGKCNYLTMIGKGAFEACGLKGRLVLPRTLTDIDDKAFALNRFREILVHTKVLALGVNSITPSKRTRVYAHIATPACRVLQTAINSRVIPLEYYGDKKSIAGISESVFEK